MKRRTIDLRSSDEVIAEIERLRDGGYEMAGNWNLTQACEHLSGTMDGGMDGFGFRLPWILRATVVKWVFYYSLRTRKMMKGAPTLPSLKPKAEPGPDRDDVIDHCIASCRRVADFAGPLKDYPLLNDPPVADWREFMWLHASHHLGFLIPNSESASG